MYKLNQSCFLILILIILAVNQVSLADDGTAPIITGTTAAITDNNAGTIAIIFQDDDGAETVESTQLRFSTVTIKTTAGW